MRTGESSATSYHLRQLAAYGFVVEDPGHGRGRERYWRAVERSSLPGRIPVTNGTFQPAQTKPRAARLAPNGPPHAAKASAEASPDETWERCEWFLDLTTEESDELAPASSMSFAFRTRTDVANTKTERVA